MSSESSDSDSCAFGGPVDDGYGDAYELLKDLLNETILCELRAGSDDIIDCIEHQIKKTKWYSSPQARNARNGPPRIYLDVLWGPATVYPWVDKNGNIRFSEIRG